MNSRLRLTVLAATSLLSLGLGIGSPRGDEYAIDWWMIAGGGAMFMTDPTEEYELSGTIGQCDAGETLNAGEYELTGGFWAIAASEPEPCAGDLDGDNDTDQADLGILLADWGCTADCSGDLDGDDDTDQADLGILLADWGCAPSP